MGYHSEYGNNKNLNHLSKLYYLKKVAPILLSVSVFSFLFSQSSLVHIYDYLVSNFSIKLFTYTTERNCIFLLCNGILVLIIRTSGLTSKITPVHSVSKGPTIGDHHGEKEEGSGFQEEKPKVEEQEEEVVVEEAAPPPEEEEEEGLEELNKKCEDFIKKVKQEIQGA